MTITQKKPRILNINPLSIVKFFYERLGEKALEQGFIHPVLYLTEREIQKKEKIFLFREEFKDWEAAPVLLSVFDYLEKLKSPSSFRHIPDITDELIVYHLENICQRYQRKFESSDFKLGFFVCDLQFRAQKLAGNL